MARVDLVALQQRLAAQKQQPPTPPPEPPAWHTRPAQRPQAPAPSAAAAMPRQPARPATVPAAAPVGTLRAPPVLTAATIPAHRQGKPVTSRTSAKDGAPPASARVETTSLREEISNRPKTETADARQPTDRTAFPVHAPADAETIAHNQRLEAQWLREHEQARAARELRWGRAEALLTDWQARWPGAFCDPPVPLKIGIDAEIRTALQQAAEGGDTTAPSWTLIKGALGRWTRRPAYRAALAAAPYRIGLDGQPAGEIADEHRPHARDGNALTAISVTAAS
jgi:ProQ/FINO family